jgi:hypothetical protein
MSLTYGFDNRVCLLDCLGTVVHPCLAEFWEQVDERYKIPPG